MRDLMNKHELCTRVMMGDRLGLEMKGGRLELKKYRIVKFTIGKIRMWDFLNVNVWAER